VVDHRLSLPGTFQPHNPVGNMKDMKDYESAPHCMPMLTLLVKKKLKVLTPP
jgi:hypothetical protein